MIKFENYEVVGWEHAIRGMRNPKNSWEKSDSDYRFILCSKCDTCLAYKNETWEDCDECDVAKQTDAHSGFMVGPNDHKLMMNLSKAGSDHRKYLRYIDVYVDITAPLYFWKEFKTYRHGRKFMDDENFFDYDDDELLDMHIETNSCSTMHTIHEKEFTLDDFSHEHLRTDKGDFLDCAKTPFSALNMLEDMVTILNTYRERYIETNDKQYWWQLIQLLPSSYNQKRTVKMNYECLARMYRSRRTHKLDEWRELCKWIESLPYSELITGETKGE